MTTTDLAVAAKALADRTLAYVAPPPRNLANPMLDSNVEMQNLAWAVLRALEASAPPVGEGMREKVAKLPTFDPVIEGGCECCGTWAVMELDPDGEWLRREDVFALLSSGEA